MSSIGRRTDLRGFRQKRGRGLLTVLVATALALFAGAGWLLRSPAVSPRASDPPEFPGWLQAMSPQVRQVYAQALTHRQELAYIPCFCGCGHLGHKAVADCYVANIADDGIIVYEQHAAT